MINLLVGAILYGVAIGFAMEGNMLICFIALVIGTFLLLR